MFYEAEAGAQGSAMFGIAALIDRAGHDTYRSFTLSQGFGGAEGAGALIDGGGDDTYTVDIGDLMLGGHSLYFSPQLPGAGNSSMSQGAAQAGARRTPRAAYMAGGLGVLYDKQGKDKYTGSVFAQGVGYWQGLGMLIEGGGDDEYDARSGTSRDRPRISRSRSSSRPEATIDTTSACTPPPPRSASAMISRRASTWTRAATIIIAAPASLSGAGTSMVLMPAQPRRRRCVRGLGRSHAGRWQLLGRSTLGEDRQMAPTIGIFVHIGWSGLVRGRRHGPTLGDSTWSYEPQPYPAPQMVTTEHGCGAGSAGWDRGGPVAPGLVGGARVLGVSRSSATV